MGILHFVELGDTESVVTNAVVLVFGDSTVRKGSIYPHIKLYFNVLGIDNAMPL